MGQCSEVEGLLLAFVTGYRSNILTTSLHCKVHFAFKLKKDSILLSSLPVTWLCIMFSDHRQEKSLQSNHSLHSTKLGKFPCRLLTLVLLTTEIVPLTDIIHKWHLLMHNYPRRYVVEHVSQLKGVQVLFPVFFYFSLKNWSMNMNNNINKITIFP